LYLSGQGEIDRVRRDHHIADAFEQASGHASQGAEECPGLLGQQASAFDKLQQQMGDLQQAIEVLDLPFTGAVGMFQIEERRSSGC
jgi:hypothetical protein